MREDEFGEWLKKEMNNKGLSRREIAKKANIGLSTVRCFENGIGSPTMYTVNAILNVLGKKIVIVDK